jgi:predicted transposase YbfD/YdcC
MKTNRKNQMQQNDDYFPGKNCFCAALSKNECACGADWTPKMQKNVERWYKMKPDEMRLRCGEMTAQEIRTVKAILKNILNDVKND